MPEPITVSNILVGSGKLFKLWEGKVDSMASSDDTIVLDGDYEPPGFEEGDKIRIYGTSEEDNDGIYTVASYDSESETITAQEAITVNSTGGTVISFERGEESLGGTEDGMEFNLSKDFHDTEAAEAPVILNKTLTGMSGTLSVGLLESTLDNLLISWPGEYEVVMDVGTLQIGVEDVHPKNMPIKMTGNGPDGSERTYIFYNMVSTGDGGHAYTKGADTVISTEFEMMAIWDETYGFDGGWSFGFIDDVS